MADEFHDEEPTPFSSSGKPKDYWDSDEADELLKMERTMNPDETNRALTQRLFEEAGPQAALTLIHLAQHATNENTRMNSAKYVTERILGKIGDGETDEESPLDRIVKEMNNKLESYANGE